MSATLQAPAPVYSSNVIPERTLLAGLEMARGGALRLRQEHDFEPILVRRGATGVEEGA